MSEVNGNVPGKRVYILEKVKLFFILWPFRLSVKMKKKVTRY